MAVYDSVGAGEAAAEVATARAMGKTIAFTHRSSTSGAVTLYANVLGESISDKYEGDTVVEARNVEIVVPVQTGFAVSSGEVEPVTLGDQFTYQGKRYEVVVPLEKMANGYLYKLTGQEHKALATGVR